MVYTGVKVQVFNYIIFNNMKRRTSIILSVLLGSFFVISQVFSASTDIVITEVGAYESSNHEWIEIWNKGVEAVDLTGWKFWENGTNHNLVSTTDFILNGGEYGVIVQDGSQFILDYPFFTGPIFDSSWSSLNESGEEIGIKDSAGNMIEQFTYIAAPDFSLQRRDPFLTDYTAANWVQHIASNTVGRINFFAPTTTEQTVPTTTPATSTPVTSTSTPTTTTTTVVENVSSGSGNTTAQPTVQNLLPIKINELVADPGDANEWVELYNTSLNTIDISGALLCDNRNTISTCKKLTGSIGPKSWLFVDLQTKSFLNNSGDSAILKDILGTVIDRIDYDDEFVPDQGQSLARAVDGVDTDSDADWAVTNLVSPGRANTFGINEKENTASSTVSNTSSTEKITSQSIKKPTLFAWEISAPATADIGEIITASVDGTADPRGGSLSFLWTLENGTHSNGPEIKTSFATPGLHTLLVSVQSTSGYTDEQKIEITVGTSLSVQADVAISEVLPNPDGEDSAEFIEIKNNATQPANLSGWFLQVGEKKFVLPENTVIVSNGFLTFYKAATKINLVNTAGKVELLYKNKTVVDLVRYEKPPSGKSYSLVNGQWAWVTPNPGADVLVNTEGQVAGEKITAADELATGGESATKPAGVLVTNIAEARAAAKGQPAKLQGIVTVVPNVFGSQFFYITGDGAGISIYQSKKDFPPVGVGDLVEVAGMVSEASGIKRINIKNSEAVDILSLDNSLEAIPINLDEINEDMAGTLVHAEGEITEIKSTFMYLDDGAGEVKVYFKKNANIDKKLFKEGQKVSVVGVLEKTSSEWQIWPRSSDDIKPVGVLAAGPGEVLGEKIETPAAEEKKINRYVVASTIGVAAVLLAIFAKIKGPVLVGALRKTGNNPDVKG